MKKLFTTLTLFGSLLVCYAQSDSSSAAFTLSVDNITISENTQPLTQTSAPVSVTLSAQPDSDVTITLDYSDETEFTVSPTTASFTSSNWSTPQTFTFTAINDNTYDGNVTIDVDFISTTTSAHDSGSGDGSHDSGSGDGSHDSGSGDGSHDSGSGDGSHDSGSGDGSHDSGSGDGSHDSGSGDGSHDSGSGDGSHDSGSGDGSHDSGSGDGSHDSGSGDGSHDSGSGDGSHDSGSGDGSHDSGSGDGGSDVETFTLTLTVQVNDYNVAPLDVNNISVKIGFNVVGFKLTTAPTDADGDTISLIESISPTNGTIALSQGDLIYTPDDGFVGSETISVKFSDGLFETAATNISISVIGRGDIDGNGSVSTTDLVYLASHIVEIDSYTMPESFVTVFDVDKDGEVGLTDLVYLASHVVGIEGYDLD